MRYEYCFEFYGGKRESSISAFSETFVCLHLFSQACPAEFASSCRSRRAESRSRSERLPLPFPAPLPALLLSSLAFEKASSVDDQLAQRYLDIQWKWPLTSLVLTAGFCSSRSRGRRQRHHHPPNRLHFTKFSCTSYFIHCVLVIEGADNGADNDRVVVEHNDRDDDLCLGTEKQLYLSESALEPARPLAHGHLSTTLVFLSFAKQFKKVDEGGNPRRIKDGRERRDIALWAIADFAH